MAYVPDYQRHILEAPMQERICRILDEVLSIQHRVEEFVCPSADWPAIRFP